MAMTIHGWPTSVVENPVYVGIHAMHGLFWADSFTLLRTPEKTCYVVKRGRLSSYFATASAVYVNRIVSCDPAALFCRKQLHFGLAALSASAARKETTKTHACVFLYQLG
ncbi:unnamed protein product [Durusdinium trenchii]|uniref:Uncharacterized protein n=1 Tax=Durusdinium trenchii TaxID=1381693 RepID=A0ABP0PB83_9DINO